jgi:hypothetical protein
MDSARAAADSHYHFEGRIKTKLLHVDYIVNHCQGMLQPRSPVRDVQCDVKGRTNVLA